MNYYFILICSAILHGNTSASILSDQKSIISVESYSKEITNEVVKDSVLIPRTIDSPIIDTIHIGSNRDIKSLNDYFAIEGAKEYVHILIDEGTYYSNELWIGAQHIVVEGLGQVNLYCTEYSYETLCSGKA